MMPRIALVLVACFASCMTPCPAVAASCCGCGSEFWVVNSRCASFHCRPHAPLSMLRVTRREGCRLRRSSLDALRSAESKPLFIYAHGNGLSPEQAIKFGTMFYNNLRCQTCQPFRFVLWSWPADTKVKGLIKGFRAHASQAVYEGTAVARFVATLPRDGQPITFGGHSLGGVVALSAPHFLGGGRDYWGRFHGAPELAGDPAGGRTLRSVQIAGAVDNDVLLPGHQFDQAMHALETLMVFFNPTDRNLKFWPRVSARGRPAISRAGVACPWLLGANRAKIRYVASNCSVGKKHSGKSHFTSPALMAQVARLVTAPGTAPSLPAAAPLAVVDVEADVEADVEVEADVAIESVPAIEAALPQLTVASPAASPAPARRYSKSAYRARHRRFRFRRG